MTKRIKVATIIGFGLLISVIVSGCVANNGGTSIEETIEMGHEWQSQEIEVETGLVTNERFKIQVLSNGHLVASGHSPLYFKESGVIASINVKEGQYVSKGQVIAELDSNDAFLSLENARVAKAKADLDLLDVLVGQGYAISDTSLVPSSVMDIAKIRSGWSSACNALFRASEEFNNCKLKAPFSGKIANLTYHVMDKVGGDPFCMMLDDSSFDVLFTVLESEMNNIEVGLQVVVCPYVGGLEPVEGKITGINPVVGKGGQIKVTARIPSVKGYLDGMNVKVKVEKPGSMALVVPKSAVVIRDGLEVLFRYNGGKAEWVYVNTVGANADKYAVVANVERGSEIHEGDEVIVNGNLNLADGSSVKKIN